MRNEKRSEENMRLYKSQKDSIGDDGDEGTKFD